MALTRAQISALQTSMLDDAAPAASILPSDDLAVREDTLDWVEEQLALRPTESGVAEMLQNIPAGPAGSQGVQGPAGPVGPVGPAGLEWRGVWAAATSYVADDAVGYSGASYFCILDITGNVSNTNPSTDTVHWALLAAQGAQGVQGVQGPEGSQGPVGPQGPAGSAALTIGSVAKSTPAAPLMYGFNTVTGGGGSVKLPNGSGNYIGEIIYVISGNSTLVESHNGSNLIYLGRSTSQQLPMVKVEYGNLWRFTHVGSGAWIAEKVIEGYREYRSRLSQTGTAAPVVAVAFVDDITVRGVDYPSILWRLLTYQYVGVGQYSLRINTATAVTLNANAVDVSFSDGKAAVTGMSNGSDGTLNWLQIDFETRDYSGVLANGLLQFTSIYLRYLG